MDAAWSASLSGPPTQTSADQQRTEKDVVGHFNAFWAKNHVCDMRLNRAVNKAFCEKCLMKLPTNFCGLDASRAWFAFWCGHALETLGEFDEERFAASVASFLTACVHPLGGFGGGPEQLAHLAPSYAATAALLIAGTEESYAVVDRGTMYKFLMRMKTPSGGFMMHEGGETDMRGTYCAIAVASMLHIVTDELAEGVPQYVQRCQSYEGGIAGAEGLEAHGGFSYCGLAAACILGAARSLDLDALLRWCVGRQMRSEGGFQGRTNKLVDSCYSFWQAATLPLLFEAFRDAGRDAELPSEHTWHSSQAVQMYVFIACQSPTGGLRDKPGWSPDCYHTCYSLSGIAASQHHPNGRVTVQGAPENLLEPVNIFYNIHPEKVDRKVAYFESQPEVLVDGRHLRGQEGAGVTSARARARLRAESQGCAAAA